MRSEIKHYLALLLVFLLAGGCVLPESQHPVTAFVNVNLVPMTSEIVLTDQVVLLKGGRIKTVGPLTDIKVPRKARIIDGTGAWLMPGLADMHVHTKDHWSGPAWPVNPLELYLANGVTTIRSFGPLGSNPEHVLKWRGEIAEGKRPGPTILTSGPILFGPVANPAGIVRKQKDQGYDFVKIYSYVTRQEFDDVILAAKKEGIYTAGHIPFLVGLDGVIEEEMDEIAHIEELDFEFLNIDPDMQFSRIDIFKDVIAQAAVKFEGDLKLGTEALEEKHGQKIREIAGKLTGRDIPVCTTLVIAESILSKLSDPESFLARPENRYVPPAYLETFRMGKEKHQLMLKGHEDLAPFKYSLDRLMAKELRRAGATLLLGTDSGTGGMGVAPGYSIHDELRILTEIGFTPYEAIRTGTVNAAKVVEKMTGEGDFGSIEPGNRADLILLRGNPLEDVANIRDPLGVMARGIWYPEDKLKQMIAVD